MNNADRLNKLERYVNSAIARLRREGFDAEIVDKNSFEQSICVAVDYSYYTVYASEMKKYTLGELCERMKRKTYNK